MRSVIIVNIFIETSKPFIACTNQIRSSLYINTIIVCIFFRNTSDLFIVHRGALCGGYRTDKNQTSETHLHEPQTSGSVASAVTCWTIVEAVSDSRCPQWTGQGSLIHSTVLGDEDRVDLIARNVTVLISNQIHDHSNNKPLNSLTSLSAVSHARIFPQNINTHSSTQSPNTKHMRTHTREHTHTDQKPRRAFGAAASCYRLQGRNVTKSTNCSE